MAFATTIGAQNLLKTATVVASSDTTNAPNLWDSLLTDFWSPSAGAQTLTIDHGNAVEIRSDEFSAGDGTLLTEYDTGPSTYSIARGSGVPVINSERVEASPASSTYVALSDTTVGTADQTVSANMLLTNTGSSTDTGLVVRSDLANDNCYYLQVYPAASELRLHKRVAGALAVISTVSQAISEDVIHSVSLSAIGTSLVVNFDGAQVISITDSAVSSGSYVGFSGTIANLAGEGSYIDDFTTSTPPPIDYIGIAGHNLGTDGASVVIAWSDDDISYTTIATLNPTDDLVIFSQFTSVSHRYTKITVTGTAAQIARINIGSAVDLSGTLNTPFTEPKDSGEYKFRTSVTEAGLPAARSVKHISYSFNMAFRNVLPSWVDGSWPDIYEAIRNDAFFLLWDADNHSNDPVFAWLMDDSQPVHNDVTYMTYSLDCMCVL